MPQTKTDDHIKMYDEAIANGDPVIVHVNNESSKATTLGTGFESPDHLIGDIEYALRTGNGTTHLPDDSAKVIEGADRVDIFTIAGHVENKETQ